MQIKYNLSETHLKRGEKKARFFFCLYEFLKLANEITIQNTDT